MPTENDVVPLRPSGDEEPPAQTVDFGGLTIAWDERVLRPRGWTLEQSLWAEALLDSLPAGPVLELCSGAGHIGLRAVVGSTRRLVCVDANPVATSYTEQNARAAGLADRVEVRTGWIEDVLRPGEVFPLVVADPPWVPRPETSRFPEDPVLAIDGGDDGLAVVRTCVRAIEAHLSPGGVALLQLGTTAQAAQVERMLGDGPVRAVEVRTFDRGVVQRLDRPG